MKIKNRLIMTHDNDNMQTGLDRMEDGKPDERIKVMVSSSVNGYEDQLESIEAMLKGWGYDVLMSMSGTIKVNPHLHNYENCLKAVEECNLFIGIIRPDCGSGREGNGCITFEEFKKARELNKPCWFIVDSRIKCYRDLMKSLELREHPQTGDEDLDSFIPLYYDRKIRNRERLPIVDKLYKSKDLHKFDPLCFKMEDFVNHKGEKRENITNNWMQYCEGLSEIYKFLESNLGNKDFVNDILKGVI